MRTVTLDGEVKRWEDYVDAVSRKGTDELHERLRSLAEDEEKAQ